jgi:predicted DNA-binding transcriptional regulator AlpA
MRPRQNTNSKGNNQMIQMINGTQKYLDQYDNFISLRRDISAKGITQTKTKFENTISITNDMPEIGGIEADNTQSASGDDDDGGDGDGDPDPERRKHPQASSSVTYRIVTETADALLWSLPTLCQRIGLSRSNIYQQIQAGKFPEPLKLGRSSRWLASEIHAWVHTQACARSPKRAG